MILNGYTVVTSNESKNLTQDHVYTYLKAVKGDTDYETITRLYRGLEPQEIRNAIFDYNCAVKNSNGYLQPYEGKTR